MDKHILSSLTNMQTYVCLSPRMSVHMCVYVCVHMCTHTYVIVDSHYLQKLCSIKHWTIVPKGTISISAICYIDISYMCIYHIDYNL